MNITLFKKIRKPILVMSVVVTMASLLFTFGDTTHQAHAAAKDTSPNLNGAISLINVQLTQTAQSLQMLNDLGSNYSDYYTQAVDDYNSNIVDPINQWFSNLAYEEQQSLALNSNSDDWNLIRSAMTESYRLNARASAVADPTSIRSGSGVSVEDIVHSEVAQDVLLPLVNQVLSDNNSNCLQLLRNNPWRSSFNVLNPITGQLVPPPQINCPFVP
jgi:hypothetical protein